MRKEEKKALALVPALLVAAAFGTASADVSLNNGIPVGTVGHIATIIGAGGETRDFTVTAKNVSNNSTQTAEIVFDYLSYVDVGNGGFRLSSSTASPSAATPSGSNAAVSNGSFTGSGGNTINWSVTSSLPNSSALLTNTFTFTAAQGTIGNLRLFQYLDEDVLGATSDVFFTRGSAAGNDLELFTIDQAAKFGISHGGAYTAGQGLANAEFEGWAADNYNDMKPKITAGTQNVSLTGVIDTVGLPLTNLDPIGEVRGPTDVVSTLTWRAIASATSVTIVTTLGGVPDITEVPPVDPPPTAIPLPAAAWAGLSGLAMVAGAKRFRRKLV